MGAPQASLRCPAAWQDLSDYDALLVAPQHIGTGLIWKAGQAQPRPDHATVADDLIHHPSHRVRGYAESNAAAPTGQTA